MPDDRKILHEFKRNADETLRVSISNFKGKTYVDLRLFYQPEGSDELAPTKKGVTITPELWDEFKAGVARVDEELQARNLWHPEGASEKS